MAATPPVSESHGEDPKKGSQDLPGDAGRPNGAPPLTGADVSRPYEPIFNVPKTVLGIIALCVLVWAGDELLLSDENEIEFLLYFAFIPARYDSSLLGPDSFPGGVGAEIWTFVTYAFLHGSALHLGMNAVWFLPFGSAVARRFGAMRFIGFFLVTAAAGALTHLMTHRGEVLPMIGASAAVSGCMAGALRFAFVEGGPLAMFRDNNVEAYQVPAVPLAGALRDSRILIFLLTWFGLNILVGIGTISMPGVDEGIAWQAHIGGFIAGLLLFFLFDPVRSPST
jgi:membrane associated rhomboid family serine protease